MCSTGPRPLLYQKRRRRRKCHQQHHAMQILPALIALWLILASLSAEAHSSRRTSRSGRCAYRGYIALATPSRSRSTPSSSDTSSSVSTGTSSPTDSTSYPHARSVRLNHGHEAAAPHYRSLLKNNPSDLSAASRIAAARSSPERHDKACPVSLAEARSNSDDKVEALAQKLRGVLDRSGYNRPNVAKLFGVNASDQSSYPWGPIYLNPVGAGSRKQPPPLAFGVGDSASSANGDEKGGDSSAMIRSLSCLVTMFLLGFVGEYI